MRRLLLALLAVGSLLLVGCAGSEEATEVEPPIPDADPSDLTPVENGKADGWAFAAGNLVDDDLFEDAGFMTRNDVQTFLEKTPYNRPSFLATHPVGDRTVAEATIDAAWRHDINPLVLLAKLQVEMGLVGKESHPGTRRVDFAMGCGCPDRRACDEARRGLDKQIDCAAERLRGYLTDLDGRGTTVAGWSVGKSRNTLDPTSVVPANRATAALYTYTPWVLVGRGGNWLFWNVFRKYATHVMKDQPNHRWIGGPCMTPDDCSSPDALCQLGACAVTCERFCPDSRLPNVSISFCAAGLCEARCDDDLYPESDGCQADRVCMQSERHNDPSTVRGVCLPGGPPL